uniref:Uncharacterized protein n=2 Tax=Aegilops tauschii subsp. strangulata TaxID=200361 RepID=A0A453QT17_AEGTS
MCCCASGRSHLVSSREGEQYELSFHCNLVRSSRVLNYAAVRMANSRFTSRSMDQMLSTVENTSNENCASECKVAVYESTGPEGGRRWTF